MRELLMSMGKNTPCPFCQAKIPASHISLRDIHESSCSVDFSCPKCNEEFSGQAFIQKGDSSANILNASSRVMIESNHAHAISQNEVQAVHKVLEKDISFQNLFVKK